MTHTRDIENLLDLWLVEGSSVAPDRVIVVIADRIEHQRQRRAWRVPRKGIHMNISLRLAASFAALAMLSAGAVYLAGAPSDSVGPQPSATASTAPTAQPMEVQPCCLASRVSSRVVRPSFTFVAAPGWEEWMGARWFSLKKPGPSGAFAAEIVFSTYEPDGDGIDCDGPKESPIAPSVDRLIVALTTDPRAITTPRGIVTLGRYSGRALDVELSPSWTGTCIDSAGQPAAWINALTYLEPDHPERLILVDVEGTIVVIRVWGPEAASFDAAVAEAMPIVDSIRFTP